MWAIPATLLIGIIGASAAANSVPTTGVDDMRRATRLADLRPPECAGQSVTALIIGTGAISGTAGSDLILGGPGDDLISGESGDDCIVGGGGDDALIGGDGNDVCLGGAGSDAIDISCE
jgi:Ca2+-binding RTX toxin-like protein